MCKYFIYDENFKIEEAELWCWSELFGTFVQFAREAIPISWVVLVVIHHFLHGRRVGGDAIAGCGGEKVTERVPLFLPHLPSSYSWWGWCCLKTFTYRYPPTKC